MYIFPRVEGVIQTTVFHLVVHFIKLSLLFFILTSYTPLLLFLSRFLSLKMELII